MSVPPSIFLQAKNPQNLGETCPPVPVFISKASDPLLSPAEQAITVGWLRIAMRLQRRRCVCVWGCVQVSARVHAHACACVRV